MTERIDEENYDQDGPDEKKRPDDPGQEKEDSGQNPEQDPQQAEDGLTAVITVLTFDILAEETHDIAFLVLIQLSFLSILGLETWG